MLHSNKASRADKTDNNEAAIIALSAISDVLMVWEDYVTWVTLAVSKSSVFKKISVHTTTFSFRFQIYPL